MNYYNEIKNKLIENEIYEKAKEHSKERHRVNAYFEVGKLLNDAGKCYGDDIIGQYSIKLMNEIGKMYNKKLLYKMRQLYALLSSEKVAPLVRQLSWSQCLLLLPIKDINKINYYIEQVTTKNLSKRGLETIIKSKEYERLPDETKNKLIKKEQRKVDDLIKDPIIIKKSNNYEEISEKILQRLILEDIPSFLKELGNGFTFIENEYKIKIGDRYNYIDLLLFNYEFNCFVAVELKVTELKKEHIGQIEIYMNYIDSTLKRIEHGKTIGIIICKKNNKYVIEFCSDKRIIAKSYELV